MENMMACRVCLATDVKLYEMCKYRLKMSYENLIGSNMTRSECQYVCSYCGIMLLNITTFREKCIRAQHILEMLVKKHNLVTTCHIKLINRHSHNLSLPYTIQKQCCDTTVTTQNFDNVTTQNFSIVTIKDENEDIKSDNNDDYNDKDVEIKNSNINEYDDKFEIHNYSDCEKIHCDSDEEPLSKKVKKKQKKSKIKTRNSFVKLKKQAIKIETDDCDIFPANNQIFLTNDKNFPTIDQNIPTNNQDFPAKNQDFPINDQDFPANDQEFPTNDQDYPANNQNYAKQELDFETEHKLTILSKEEQIEEVLSRKTSANYLNSVYKCEYCYKGFMTEATYNNHMARHDPWCGPVACPVCATRWPDARALRAHTLISHERRYTCKLCGHVSKSQHKAKEHGQWHGGATFPCRACGRAFTRSTSYLTHVRLRHATHVCAACGHSFIGENGLNMHMKKSHREHRGEVSGHECVTCRVLFRTEAARERHYGDGGACEHNDHVCVQCGDHFASEQLLKEHTDVHVKTDAVRTCSQCSRTFAHERSLAAHVQRTHARTRAHSPRHCVCEVCGYKCVSASSLVNHQRVHSGEKPHACSLCNKRFSVAQRLQIHLRTHTGERPFQCTRCPKAFKHKAALNRHDRVHSGVKPYPCPQCGKRFSQSNSMKQHCAGVHMKTYIYPRINKKQT